MGRSIEAEPAVNYLVADCINPKVPYLLNKSQLFVFILSKINSIQALPSYFLKIRFNITFPPMPWPPK